MHFTRLNRPLLTAGFLFASLASSLLAVGPYLKDFDVISVLPAPPALGTPEDVADRDNAFQVYSHGTPEDFARAKHEHEFNEFTFTPAISPSFQAGKFPKLEALFVEVLAEARAPATAAKKKWNRERPYVAEPERFARHGDIEKTAGYPSGHSTRGTLYALILAEIFPKHRDAILEKGRLIGWTRVEVGVHTPMDIYAGRVAGQALARAFLKNPEFQKDLAEVKAEVGDL